MSYIMHEIKFLKNVEKYDENRSGFSWVTYFFREEDYDAEKKIKNEVAREIFSKIKSLHTEKMLGKDLPQQKMGNFFEYVLTTDDNISVDDCWEFLGKNDCATTFCTGFSNSGVSGQWIEDLNIVDNRKHRCIDDVSQEQEDLFQKSEE